MLPGPAQVLSKWEDCPSIMASSASSSPVCRVSEPQYSPDDFFAELSGGEPAAHTHKPPPPPGTDPSLLRFLEKGREGT